MAGNKPFFITGANAKIRVNNKTLAFCTNLSYSIVVNHATPKILGMYESTGIEPLGYTVTGQFSVIRYIADAFKIGTSPPGVNQDGNGIGTWGESSYFDKLKQGLNFGDAGDSRANENLNPKELFKATGFTIEVFQKIPGSQIGVAKIRGARITKADFSLSGKSAATQTFNFTAVYADEDSFLADFSGQGQQFQ